eukprot:GHVT01013053.1.p2 GENE.GHVT01013053.1~~GHVT01013053.1.p2  ORF type:complete len:163 (-),score=16.26 GHVT01013053.1:568-1056(-)
MLALAGAPFFHLNSLMDVFLVVCGLYSFVASNAETENNSPLSPPLILVPVLATTIIGCGILGRLLVQRASKKSKAAKAEKKLKAKTAAVVPVKFSSKARVKHANVSSRLITRSSTMEWPIFYSSQQDMNSSGFQSEGWACTSAQEYSPTTEASVSSPDNYYG